VEALLFARLILSSGRASRLSPVTALASIALAALMRFHGGYCNCHASNEKR
jgi:hypothetical protein